MLRNEHLSNSESKCKDSSLGQNDKGWLPIILKPLQHFPSQIIRYPKSLLIII